MTVILELTPELEAVSREEAARQGETPETLSEQAAMQAPIAPTAAVTGTRLLTTDRDFDRLDGGCLGREWMDSVL